MSTKKIIASILEIEIESEEKHNARIHAEIEAGGEISPTFTRIVFSDPEEVSHTLTLPGFYPGLASVIYLMDEGIDFEQVKETRFVPINTPAPPVV